MSYPPLLLRYPGGKSRARKILVPLLEEYSSICAPFFGGGAVEIALADKGTHVEGYDLFPPVSNFWKWVTSLPNDVADGVQRYIGKVDKKTFDKFQHQLREDFSGSLDDAVAFFVVNRCSFSGATLSGGMSSSAAVQRFTDSSVQRVREFSQPTLTVDQGDALEVIYNTGCDALFLDPPYLLDKSSLYGDRGSHHSEFNHYGLYEALKDTDKPFVLTYNNHPDIVQLYQGNTIETAQWSYGMNKTKKSSEIIISNIPVR